MCQTKKGPKGRLLQLRKPLRGLLCNHQTSVRLSQSVAWWSAGFASFNTLRYEFGCPLPSASQVGTECRSGRRGKKSSTYGVSYRVQIEFGPAMGNSESTVTPKVLHGRVKNVRPILFLGMSKKLVDRREGRGH